MFILRIVHPVHDFNAWKRAFDSDPVGRKNSGVRRYKIFRPVDNENFVMIDLEFDTRSQAEDTLAALREVWNKVEGKIISKPQTWIVQSVESADIQS